MQWASDEIVKMAVGEGLALLAGYAGAVLRFRKTLRELEVSVDRRFEAARAKIKREYDLLEQRVSAIEDEKLREVLTQWMQGIERAMGRIEGSLGLQDRE